MEWQDRTYACEWLYHAAPYAVFLWNTIPETNYNYTRLQDFYEGLSCLPCISYLVREDWKLVEMLQVFFLQSFCQVNLLGRLHLPNFLKGSPLGRPEPLGAASGCCAHTHQEGRAVFGRAVGLWL